MSDVLDQAKRRVELGDRSYATASREELAEIREFVQSGYGGLVTLARALIETQQKLDDAHALAHQVLAEHRIRGAVLTAACGAEESVRMAREWLASVDAKGAGEA